MGGIAHERINLTYNARIQDMDPEAIAALGAGRGADGAAAITDESGRIAHGGNADPWMVDFASNANPRVPRGAARVYEAAFAAARRYPSDDYCEFRAAAAEVVGCDAREVIPTPGAMAAIRLAVGATITSGDRVAVPVPTFEEFGREVQLHGGNPDFVPVGNLLTVDPGEYSMVVACTPNDPTGYLDDRGALVRFAERCRDAGTTFLVDECYLGFTEQSSLAGLPGTIVVRSLSMLYGLPAMRAGYAVATGDLRDRLDTARPAWALGGPAAATGAYCLKQREFVAETRDRVVEERERMATRLECRYDVEPSRAPFLLVDCGDSETVDDLLEDLRAADISVRDARNFRTLDSHVRIAVRLPAENDRLLETMGV